MSSILTRRRKRIFQPAKGMVQVDSNLLDPSKIIALINCAFPELNQINGKRIPANAINFANTPAGKAIHFTGSSSEYLNLGSADSILDNNNFTLITCGVRNSSTTNTLTSHGYAAGDGSTRVLAHIPYSADGNIYFDYGNPTAGSGRISVSGSGYFTAGVDNRFGFVAGSRGREIWRNGILLASDPAATSVRGATATDFYIGATNSTSAVSPGSPIEDIYFILVTREQLFRESILAITGNPWLTFTDKKSFVFIPASGAADLSANAQAAASASGALSIATSIAGASISIASATGAVNQAVGLSGAAASVSVADGVASITVSLFGDGFIESFASGALASALALEAASQSTATAAADLSTGADLAVSAAAQSTGTGSIGLSVSLSGDSLIQALSQANLDGGAANDLAGNAAAITAATGGIMQDVPILGAATITVTGSGGVSNVMQLDGAAMVSALSGGDLQVSALGLSANAIIQALAGGSIGMTMDISADALMQALSVGTLSIGDLWSGAIIEKYTALAPERNYTALAPERNYTATA